MEKKIAHIEIAVKDINKAKEFYEKVFDWEVQTETGYPGYAFFKSGETGVGGAFQELYKTAKGAILLHIQTDDIKATLIKITDHGGKTVKEKTDIGNNYGFYAIFEDCFGNQIGLWSEK